MNAVLALALVGLLAFVSPSADARKLMQSSAINDADILNFALNLEVGLLAADLPAKHIPSELQKLYWWPV